MFGQFGLLIKIVSAGNLKPELIIPELKPNLNLSMGSVRVRFKVHEQVQVQSHDVIT